MADEEQSDAAKNLADAVRGAQASWKTDGQGVRGPQPTVAKTVSSEFERRSDSPAGSIVRQPQAVSEASEATSTAVTDVVDLFGFVNGAPGEFHLIEDSAPTSPLLP